MCVYRRSFTECAARIFAIQRDHTLCVPKIQRIKASVRPRKMELLRRRMDASRLKIHSTIFNRVNSVEWTTHSSYFARNRQTTN